MKRIGPSKQTHQLKILAVSDYTSKELIQRVEDGQLPEIDLTISCGDLDPEYLTFLRDRINRPLIYVKGNHDIRYSSSNPRGCEDIHGRIIRFGSLHIMGLEGCMWYNGGPNQYTEAMMKKQLFWMKLQIWKNRPIHMVVTHAPPRHIHDREDRCHMGFENFRRLIDKTAPDYFIHGHIHQEFDRLDDRITRFNGTNVINTCGYTLFEV